MNSRVQIVCCCVDAPARAAVLNIKQFNGYYGCTWCLQKGTYLNGKQLLNRHIDLGTVPSTLQKEKPSHGVKGPTPLMNAPGPDLVWGVNPDYLHCVLEGVTKQMCEKWLT
ncbi:unnamed protein product, partial [Ixodes persulcatus]